MVFIVAVIFVLKTVFQGIEEQYNLPMETWYTFLFSILGTLPMEFTFLARKKPANKRAYTV